jgi:flagellar basal-body rod protein FlgG
MRVSANNIANINTPGFKAGAAVTQSLAPGLGAATTAVLTDTSPGFPVFTGNSLDLAIQGEGYFQVTLPDGRTGFTRQSVLGKDSSGRLTDAAGNVLKPEITIPSNATSVTVGKDGKVTAMINGTETNLGSIELAGFNNPAGLTQAGGGIFFESAASGQAFTGPPGTGGLGTLAPGSVESSNVDLTQEIVNMIISKHGYSANARTIKASDEMLGTLLDIKT